MAQKPDNVDQDAEKIQQQVYGKDKKDKQSNDSGLTDRIKDAANNPVLKRTVGRNITNLVRLASLKYVIAAVAAVAIIIFLIGVASFFLTMPDMVRGRLVEIFDGIWTDIKGFFIGKATAQVKEEDILNVAKYLENMGYSIEGYGFGTTERDENGKIKEVDSKYILAYLAAENKTYMISNKNWNLKSFFNDILNGFDDESIDASWGDGMIVLNESLIDKNSVSVDRKKRVMEIQFQTDKDKIDTYEYNLDGWMGRYGKPIEFLLSLHTGTMAPDFAYQVAVGEEFETKVYVKFKKVGKTVRLKYTSPTGSTHYVSKSANDPEGWQYWEDIIESETERIENWIDSLPPEQQTQDADTWIKQHYGINMNDVNNAKQYEKDNTSFTYVPYIRAVAKHWFRDLDFQDCYIQTEKETVSTGKYDVFDVEEIRDGMIHQIKEPKIVGDATAAASEPDTSENAKSILSLNSNSISSLNAEASSDSSAESSSDSNSEAGSSSNTEAGSSSNTEAGSSSNTEASSSSNSGSSTISGTEYEGMRLDNLLKKQYNIADGLTGVSEEKYNIDWKMMKYSITMLETVHSEDAQCILRDLKRYLNKRDFVKFTDEYVITDPSKIKVYNDDRNLEYGGQEYQYKRPNTGDNSYKEPPLGNIFDDTINGKLSEDGLTYTLYHKDADAQDGFETGMTVKSPASGKVVNVSSNTIKIQISSSGAEGKTITITGFSVDPSIKTGDRISKGDKMGVTTESDIVITMTDEQGKAISPQGYIPILSASASEVELLARILQAEAHGNDADGMAAVGYVILRRVQSPGFPDTLEEVIYAPKQFTGVGTPNFNMDPLPLSLNVARGVLSGTMADPLAKQGLKDALFFRTYYPELYTEDDFNRYNLVVCGGNIFSNDDNAFK